MREATLGIIGKHTPCYISLVPWLSREPHMATARHRARQFIRPFAVRDTVIPIIGLLVVLALFLVLARPYRSAGLSVATPAGLLPRDGVYLVEHFTEQPGAYQWVGSNGWFQLPNPGGPLLVRLALLSGPEGATPIQLHAGQITMQFVVEPNLRRYSVLLPPSAGERVRLAIEAPAVRVKSRDLGIAVSDMKVAGGQSLPGSVISAFLIMIASVATLFRARLLVASAALLPLLAGMLWWYAGGGWVYGVLGPLCIAVAGACITGVTLQSWWPQTWGQQRAGVVQELMLQILTFGLLVAVLCSGFLLVIDRAAVPPVVPLGLAIAAVGGYALLRQVGLAAPLAIAGCLLVQLALLGAQALLGWTSGTIGSIAAVGGIMCLAAVLVERWAGRISPPVGRAVPWARRDHWVALALVGIALCVRLPWLGAPDPVGDIELVARRMGLIHADGLAAAYTFEGDYMPLWLYIVSGLRFIVLPLGGAFFEPLPPITRIIVKFPSVVADVATVVLFYWWGRRWCSRRDAALITALYTLSPPVWINSAWWGQTDTLLMLPLLGSITLLDKAGGRWSWLLWAIAQATKPQAIVILPILAVTTLRKYGCRGLVQGGAIAAGVLGLAALPLVAAGQGEELLFASLTSVGRFPLVTNGAYNLGYLLTAGQWAPDTALWLNLVSYKSLGFALLSGITLLICTLLVRRTDTLARVLGASAMMLAFFLLPTQIRERYLFLPLAFLALSIPIDRSYVLLYLMLMLSATFNIFGDLDGFLPLATAAIRATPLPFALAIGNLAILVALLWRLAAPAASDAEGDTRRLYVKKPLRAT
jgi:hypothetical protein